MSTGVSGLSANDSKGDWVGLDVDLCRAIAITLFGDASKAKILSISALQRFTALQSGEVDVLTRNTTLSLTRDTTLGLIGVGVNYYDSQGIMVNKSLNVKSAKELDGATVCVQPGTTTELNLADWFRSQGIAFKPVVVERLDEIIRSFAVGRCDAFTGDKSQLAAARSTLANPDQYVILPENFSGTARPDGAPGRRAVVQHRALDHVRHDGSRGIRHHLQERGRDAESTNPNVQRLLGVTPGMGKNLGVDDKWAYNVIKRIGNYGESYEKTWARAAR